MKGALGTGTPNGGVTFAGPKLPGSSAGPSTSFAGTGHIAFTHNALLELPAGTLIAFVQPAAGSLSNRMGIITRRRAAGDNTDFGLFWFNAELVFEIHDGTTAHQAAATGVLQEGTPACIIATWGPAGMVLRVNQQTVATNPHTGAVPAAGGRDWLVGARSPGGVIDHFWTGLISQVQIYDRVLTTGEIAKLCPFGPPATLAAITSLGPRVYLPATDGTVADTSGNSISASINGAPAGLTETMSLGTGIDLGGTADVQIPHATVFNTSTGVDGDGWTQWETIDHTYAYSEVAFVGRFIVNETLRDDLCLFRKGDEALFQPGFAVSVMADGRVRLKVANRHYFTLVDSPAGRVRRDVEFSVGVRLGRNGAELCLDGAMCNRGMPDGRAYHGLEHRYLGILVRNERPIRIGLNRANVRSDITFNHFAAFFRNSAGPRLMASDLQTIAGGAAAALNHPRWALSSFSANASNVQARIDSAFAAGGGTVTYNDGSTIPSESLPITLKSGVLLVLQSDMVLANTSAPLAFTTPNISLTDRSLASNVSAGSTTVTLANASGVTAGQCLFLGGSQLYEDLFALAGASRDDKAIQAEPVVGIIAVNGNTLTLDRPLEFSYTASDVNNKGRCGTYTPTSDCGIIGPGRLLTLSTNSDWDATKRWCAFKGTKDLWLDTTIKSNVVSTNHRAITGVHLYGTLSTLAGPNAVLGTEAADAKWGDNNDGKDAVTGKDTFAGDHHPYGVQNQGCRDNCFNSALLRSRGWHGIDHTNDNFLVDWGVVSGTNLQWSNVRTSNVDSRYSSDHQEAAFGSHASHATRVFGCESINGGTFLLGGGWHDANGFTSRGDGRRLGWGLNFFYTGCGFAVIVNVQMNQTSTADHLFDPKSWFFTQRPPPPPPPGTSQSGRSIRGNLFAHIHRKDPSDPPTSGPNGTFSGNTCIKVDAPKPPA